MRAALTTLCLSVLALAPDGAAVPSTSGQATSVQATSSQESPREARLRQARARWERLTPEQQERARENYERFLSLEADQREDLMRRAERMKLSRERIESELPPDVHRDIGRLEPERGQQVLRDLVEAESIEIGRRIRAKLPEDLRRKLEEASPEERAELLRKFQHKQRGRVARAAIEIVARELGLPAERIAELQGLPEEPRAQALLGLRRDLEAKRVREVKPPVPAPERESPGARYAPAPPRGGEPLPRVLRRLAEAVQPNPRDALELAELTRPERQAQMARRRRERCLALLQGEHLLPPERVTELQALSDAEFFDVIRQILAYTGYIESPESGAPR